MNSTFVMRRPRLVLAALLAPMSAPLLYVLATFAWSGYPASGPGHAGKLVDEFLLALLPPSYFLSLCIGTPVVLVLQRIHRLTTWRCVLVAALIGAVLGLCTTFWFSGPPGSHTPLSARLALSALGALAAMIIALVFCGIAGLPVMRRTF
ncbi:hypothetical protein [Rhizobacter sp. OV335]|uniref:hypothetical protein n=1 Tax=Rhizobacter sp. OV335 TaxID=1500264 RepID=UPI00116101CA|nr:hypothetical protein [Rhizobacter sp. OV335]